MNHKRSLILGMAALSTLLAFVLFLILVESVWAADEGSVSGVVTEIDGITPILDAQVCINAYNESNGYGCIPVNATDGTYQFTGLPAGSYRVEAFAPGREDEFYLNTPYYNLATPVTVASLTDTPNINFTLGLGAYITGTISGSGIPPLSNQTMICVEDAVTQDQLRCRNDGLDLDTGVYSVGPVPSGTYKVQVRVPNYIQEYYQNSYTFEGATPVTVNASTDTTGINFVLDLGGSVSGKVTGIDGTTLITNATVCVRAYDESAGYPCVGVDPVNATYTVSGLPTGTYRVEANAPDKENELYPDTPFYNLADAIVVTAPNTTPNINFTLGPGASISGTITGATLPLDSDSRVCINDAETDNHVRCRGGDVINYSTGNYLFDYLPSGLYRVEIESPGWIKEYYPNSYTQEGFVPVEVAAPTDVTNINFELEAAGGFSGVVKDTSNNLLQSVHICVGSYSQNTWYSCVDTDVNGAYLFNILPSGQFRLSAQKNGYVQTYYPNTPFYNDAEPFDITAPNIVPNVNFTLALAGTISGTVNASDSGVLNNVIVCVNDYATNKHVQCRNNIFLPGPNTYVFEGVPSGSYRVNVSADNYRNKFYNNTYNYDSATPVVVTASSNTPNINFMLDPGGTISGKVFAADGVTPLANIPVDLDTGGYGRCTDALGNYSLTNLPLNTALIIKAGGQGWPQCPGDNHLREYWQEAANYNDADPITLTLGVNQFENNINFTLDVGGAITGHVSDGVNDLADVNVCIQIHVWGEGYGCYQTDTNGDFTIDALPAGNYRLDFNKAGYASEIYDNKLYYGDHSLATAVTVTLGNITTLNEIVLAPGGSISGTVYAADGTTPLASVPVGLFWGGSNVCTDAQGKFTIAELPLNVPIELYAGGAPMPWMGCNNGGYIQEWWELVPDENFDDRDPITLTPGNPNQGNFNLLLDEGGTVSGTISGSNGVGSVRVQLGYMGEGYGDPWNGPSTCSNPDGTYTITGVRFDDQFVLTAGDDCGGINHGYAREWWEEGVFFDEHEYLTITAAAPDLTNINFTLQVGGLITGRVTDAVTGAPIPNINVDSFGLWLGACTDDEGYYTLGVVPADIPFGIGAAMGPNYCQNGAPHPYAEEAYPEGADDPVMVGSGETLENINFTLSLFLPEPTNLIASGVSKTQIDLSWTDNATDETGYKLERVLNDVWSPTVILPANTTTYSDPDLVCGTEYAYRLYAYRAGANANDYVNSYYVWTVATTDACAVILLLPEDGAELKNLTPEFTWNPVDNAQRYRLQIDDADTFDTPIINLKLGATSFIPTEPLTPGTYYWHVQVQLVGSEEWSEWSELRSFLLDKTKPAAPTLLLPTNEAVLTVQPVFSWSAVIDAAEYVIQIADNPDFVDPVFNVTTVDATYTPDPALADGLYFWHVRAKDAAGNKSPWSEVWSVRVDVIPNVAPVLTAPVDEARMRQRRPLFMWEPVTDAKRYQIQIDDNADFSSPVINLKSKLETFTPSVNLLPGVYYWHVRTQSTDGLWSEYSAAFSFEIDRTGPAAPVLLSPLPNEIVTTNTPTFDWGDNTEVDLDHYIIQIDNNKDFSSPLLTVEVDSSTYTSTLALSNRRYFWRVRAVDDVGNKGEWSGGRKFTVNVLRNPAG